MKMNRAMIFLAVPTLHLASRWCFPPVLEKNLYHINYLGLKQREREILLGPKQQLLSLDVQVVICISTCNLCFHHHWKLGIKFIGKNLLYDLKFFVVGFMDKGQTGQFLPPFSDLGHSYEYFFMDFNPFCYVLI